MPETGPDMYFLQITVARRVGWGSDIKGFGRALRVWFALSLQSPPGKLVFTQLKKF